MSNFRNISGQDREVVYGFPFPTLIADSAVCVVPDEIDESYSNQPEIWEAVAAPSKKSTNDDAPVA